MQGEVYCVQWSLLLISRSILRKIDLLMSKRDLQCTVYHTFTPAAMNPLKARQVKIGIVGKALFFSDG